MKDYGMSLISAPTGFLPGALVFWYNVGMSLDRQKFDALVKHINSGEYWVPEVGEYVYMDSESYIDHGEDDIVGGLATVTKVGGMSFDDGTAYIAVAEVDSGDYNWPVLFESQRELMGFFGDRFTYSSPDFE